MQTLSPLPPSASPYERLSLAPAPLFEAETILAARARALSAWSPLREERLYQPRGVQQRALIIRDAERLRHLASALRCYFTHVVLPSVERLYVAPPLTREPSNTSPLEESFEQRLCEGAQVLERERLALLALPSELNDVDALQERHRLLSKVARFEQLYASYLGEAMQCLLHNINLSHDTTDQPNCERLTRALPPELEPEGEPSMCAQASLASTPVGSPPVGSTPVGSPPVGSPPVDAQTIEPLPPALERPQGALKSLTSLQWSPRFQPLIERQLKLLSQLEAEMLSFESPTRSRWAHAQRDKL